LGNLFVASQERIFKISTSMLVTTYAGNPDHGSSAENVSATLAIIAYATRITGDSAGNIYFLDNAKIRKVTAGSHLVRTVVGNGNFGYNGENVAALSTYMYPSSIWVTTNGNMYIGETQNYRIRKWTASTGLVTTFAGNGTYGFSDNKPATSAMFKSAYSIVGDSNGNVFLADSSNYRVRKISTSGIITTYAGVGVCCYSSETGPATSIMLSAPYGLLLDSTGNLYIAISSRILMVSPSGTAVSVIAGGCSGVTGDGGAATSACIGITYNLWMNTGGQLYLPQTSYYRIRKVSSSIITTIAGNGLFAFAGDGGQAKNAQMFSPSGTFADTNGNVYIVDTGNCRVRLVNHLGIISSIGGTGTCLTDADGDAFSATSLSTPRSIWKDTAGNLYFSESNAVRKVNTANIVSTVAGRGSLTTDNIPATSYSFISLWGIWGDTLNNLYICDYSDHFVKKMSLSSSMLLSVAGNGNQGSFGDNGPATLAMLNYPRGIWVDSVGKLFIADSQNYKVRIVENGIIDTFAGTGNYGYNGNAI
jgi:sugar lactone lactonase YvrE